MSKSGSFLFNELYQAGSNAFKLLKKEAISPLKNKTLKDWGISEAAEMIGRTSPTLRKLEETHPQFKARLVNKGKRQERVYSLKEINALRDHYKTRPRKPNNCKAIIMACVNFKGGGAKTTTAVCAAQFFAQKGYRTLLCDCDSQGSATHMHGYIPDEDFSENDTILNLLIGKEKNIRKLIQKTYWDGLDLIPANLSLYNAELIMPTQIANHLAKTGEQPDFYNQLNKAFFDIQDDYDVIILDCPPSMGMISINAIYAADALLIEMPPVIVDFASTIQFFKMVSEVLERLPEKVFSFVRILLTRHNGRTNAKELEALLRGFFGQFVMSNIMSESEAISKAASNLQTLYEIDKFAGDKRTYERAVQRANMVNNELEDLVTATWNQTVLVNKAATMKEETT